MLMPRADLADLDPLLGLIGRSGGRFEPPPGRDSRTGADGGCEKMTTIKGTIPA